MVALHEVACINKDEIDALDVLKTIKNSKYLKADTDYSLLNNNDRNALNDDKVKFNK